MDRLLILKAITAMSKDPKFPHIVYTAMFNYLMEPHDYRILLKYVESSNNLGQDTLKWFEKGLFATRYEYKEKHIDQSLYMLANTCTKYMLAEDNVEDFDWDDDELWGWAKKAL